MLLTKPTYALNIQLIIRPRPKIDLEINKIERLIQWWMFRSGWRKSNHIWWKIWRKCMEQESILGFWSWLRACDLRLDVKLLKCLWLIHCVLLRCSNLLFLRNNFYFQLTSTGNSVQKTMQQCKSKTFPLKSHPNMSNPISSWWIK